MPTETVWIEKVTKWPDTSGRGFHVYVVQTSQFGLTLTTTDAWKASLCDQARKAHQRVSLSWRDVWKGKKYLETIKLEAQHEPVADQHGA